ncbi:Uncharacterised protein [Vibrio cholerae]|nr:Uncharacterised protein [Vibrio cholerae]
MDQPIHTASHLHCGNCGDDRHDDQDDIDRNKGLFSRYAKD